MFNAIYRLILRDIGKWQRKRAQTMRRASFGPEKGKGPPHACKRVKGSFIIILFYDI